jgi:predicted nucleic acid-binding protein
MPYLLDTNVVSELHNIHCNPYVRNFMRYKPIEEIYLCGMTIGEISNGMEILEPGEKKHELTKWLYRDLTREYKDRIIPMGFEEMCVWGRLIVAVKRTLPWKDSLIAACALAHDLTILTRNTQDFADIEGLKLINPWEPVMTIV